MGHTAEDLKKLNGIEVIYLKTDDCGNPSIVELESELNKPVKTLVSLMHANNEIGTLLPLKR